jgi:hypothetical protein
MHNLKEVRNCYLVEFFVLLQNCLIALLGKLLSELDIVVHVGVDFFQFCPVWSTQVYQERERVVGFVSFPTRIGSDRHQDRQSRRGMFSSPFCAIFCDLRHDVEH